MWDLTFTFRDDENHTSQFTLHFPDSVTVANFGGVALSFLTVLGPLTDAAFVKATISKVVAVGSSAAETGADIEIGAKFLFAVTGLVKRVAMTIPAFVRSKLIPTTSKVDMTDTDVVDFVEAIEDGMTSTTLFEPSNDVGDDISAVVVAEETYGKKRKNR
jgi:hypothetical protein